MARCFYGHRQTNNYGKNKIEIHYDRPCQEADDREEEDREKDDETFRAE